jgi:DNA-directed RNA polymerase specialized sigma24 family protein
MSDHTDTSRQLQALIDRMMQGDDEARKLLLERACKRLERIVRKRLRSKFPRLKNQHNTESILSQTYLRLDKALKNVQAKVAERDKPMQVVDFFQLAALKCHQVLLDLAKREEPSGLPDAADPVTHDDPSDLADWTEFHEQVEKLPSSERAVFELCFYLGLKRQEAAQVLSIHPREASRRWVAATEKLKDILGDLFG